MGAFLDRAVSNPSLAAYSFADRQAVPAKCFCQAGFCEHAKFCDSAIYKPVGLGYELRTDKGNLTMRECWINVYKAGNRYWYGKPRRSVRHAQMFAEFYYVVYRLHVRLK